MKLLTTLLSAACLLVLGTTSASAQDGPLTWTPVELIGCNFNDGSNMEDLNGVIDTWNEWMDETGQNDYLGVVLEPYFTATDFPFDVLWLGAWQDAAGMAGMQQWLTDGAEILADFGEVVTCPLHQGFASANIKQPGEAEGIVPVAFQNCTIAENRSGPQAVGAITEFSEYLTEQGHNGGHWIMRPAAGEATDASYNFKWVRSHSSWAALGDYFEVMYNQGGFGRLGDGLENLLACDSPRVYNSRLARDWAQEE